MISQPSYRPADVPFQTLRALRGAVRTAMTPDAIVFPASMTEGNKNYRKCCKLMISVCANGVTFFFQHWMGIRLWISIEFIPLMRQNALFRGQNFLESSTPSLKFKQQLSEQRPGKRAFGRANSGLIFPCCQAVDKYSYPLILLVYTDKSFSGKHSTLHPIYSE